MIELDKKTVLELREIARERKVATLTEISRARKSTLLEWVEQSERKSAKVVSEETKLSTESEQGELFSSSKFIEKEAPKSTETEIEQSSKPVWENSSSSKNSKESSREMLTLILIGFAVLGLVIFLIT